MIVVRDLELSGGYEPPASLSCRAVGPGRNTQRAGGVPGRCLPRADHLRRALARALVARARARRGPGGLRAAAGHCGDLAPRAAGLAGSSGRPRRTGPPRWRAAAMQTASPSTHDLPPVRRRDVACAARARRRSPAPPQRRDRYFRREGDGRQPAGHGPSPGLSRPGSVADEEVRSAAAVTLFNQPGRAGRGAPLG